MQTGSDDPAPNYEQRTAAAQPEIEQHVAKSAGTFPATPYKGRDPWTTNYEAHCPRKVSRLLRS